MHGGQSFLAHLKSSSAREFAREPQDQQTIVLVEFRQLPPQPAKVPRVLALASPKNRTLFRDDMRMDRRLRRLIALMKKAVHGDFESACKFLKSLDRGSLMIVFDLRDIRSLHPGTFFDVSLGQIFL